MCNLPISQNPSVIYTCEDCHKQFHARCIWGQFYLMGKGKRHELEKKKRWWICGRCLVNKHIEVYWNESHRYHDSDSLNNSWECMFVVGFISSRNRHNVKHYQNIFPLHLGAYRVRLIDDHSELHTLTNSSVLEVIHSIRRYRSLHNATYHSLPQVVGIEHPIHCSYPFDRLRIPATTRVYQK